MKPKAAISWPATALQLEAAGWRLELVRRCRLCPASIEFWVKGKTKMPLDQGERGLRSPHWASCPRAAEFRTRSKQGDLFP